MITVQEFKNELSDKDGAYVAIMTKKSIYMISKEDIYQMETKSGRPVGIILDIQNYED